MRLDPTSRALMLGSAIAVFLVPVNRPPAPSAAIGQSHTYVGTVRGVQPTTASLDLITGIGYAIRTVHVSISASTKMVSGSTAIDLSGIAPGNIVRAECHMTPSGLVADRIERLSPAGSASGRVP